MNLDEIWSEIEEEYKWRSDEIRFFTNQLLHLSSVEDKDKFRRAIVLMLYAHFEGFCKFAFLLYTTSINKEKLKCRDVTHTIAASGLAKLFEDLRNPNRRSDHFKRELPDDTQLHRSARDIEFLEALGDINEKTLEIPEKLIDTESNLKPVVLRKILFRLGLDHTAFSEIESDISKLLGYRNAIAHGEKRDGIDENTYDTIRKATFKVIDQVKSFVMQSLSDRVFLRQEVK
ncbi:MAE_28990/MAE_18760 family HEPN-like nuclease [Chitinophaga sp. HK235]|uniref:MAE_28990/MAE_18760 family HEPN-like nuclease n=1 Tax=Chitinophaga sp. HK235 TaxID=2952571 RepID=UPI001BAA1323|nr:MAE_28990/MAE_18760 family HEPN-like nuclease [Chitinophaga sp. HK235]